MPVACTFCLKVHLQHITTIDIRRQKQQYSCRRLYVLHAHSYFPYSTDEEKVKANKWREAVQSKFADIPGIKIANITPEAVGPHPRPEFETAFTKHHLAVQSPRWFQRPLSPIHFRCGTSLLQLASSAVSSLCLHTACCLTNLELPSVVLASN